MKKILCIGHASYDITIPFYGYPIENSKNRVEGKVECGGGPASNAAYLLGKWGLNSYFVGLIGNDREGQIILNEMDSVNVNTELVEINREMGTTISYIIANQQSGSRTVLTNRAQGYKMTPVSLAMDADYILVDGQELELSLSAIKENPSAISVLDAGTAKPATIELGKVVDYLVCSKKFAETIADEEFDYKNTDTIVSIYRKLENKFKTNIIITLEEKGSLCKVEDNLKLISSINVKAKDTTGAGDIFHGAFVFGLAKGLKMEDILKFSNVTSAISVKTIGGRYSIPNLEEVINESGISF